MTKCRQVFVANLHAGLFVVAWVFRPGVPMPNAAAVAELDRALAELRETCWWWAGEEAFEAESNPPTNLPPDLERLHSACVGVIEREDLSRGEVLWMSEAGDMKHEPKAMVNVETWEHYGRVRGMPGDAGEAEVAIITNTLTFPMTIYHVLRATVADGVFAFASPRLEIHVLGAAFDTEADGSEKWAELLRFLPWVAELRLVLVGPEIPEDMSGKKVAVSVEATTAKAKGKKKSKKTTAERTASVEFHTCLYHDLPAGAAGTPDLVVGFNTGLADLRDEWAPTITQLRAQGHLVCFTSYNATEAVFDARTLEDVFDARILSRARPNPFKSQFPNPDPVYGDRAFHVNAFYTIFRGARESTKLRGKKKKKKRFLRRVVRSSVKQRKGAQTTA